MSSGSENILGMQIPPERERERQRLESRVRRQL
jgi:hypothetical protein